jgi:NAD(P)-dependent dehydrogenase (short-subunit alcohol dehydrogenase family)
MILNDSMSAIVTGGASGLGAQTARRLAGEGVGVVVVDLDEMNGKAVADEINGVFVPADVADEEQVIAAVDAASDVGALRVLVCCAGIPSGTRTIGRGGAYDTAHPLGSFAKVVNVNLLGTFNCVRLAATAMSRLEPLDDHGERGAIVTTASVAAFDGQVGQAAYSASKAGVAGMTLPVARDLAVAGVRINTIAPGLIETPIYGSGEEAEAFKERLAKDVVFPKRLGRSEEFASLVVELLSNSYMNGEVVRLDAAIRLPPR